MSLFKEVSRIYSEHKQSRVHKGLAMVREYIRNHPLAGRFEVQEDNVSQEAIDILRREGFTIQRADGINLGPYFLIRWDV